MDGEVAWPPTGMASGRVPVLGSPLMTTSAWPTLASRPTLFSLCRRTSSSSRCCRRGMKRPLTVAEHDVYRDPFRTPRDRLPVLRWIQQIPVGGHPAAVDAVVRRNQDVLLRGSAPRLLLHGEPGSVVGSAEVNWCRREGAGLDIVSVGAGTHFLPEDQPAAISRALAAWLARHRPAPGPG